MSTKLWASSIIITAVTMLAIYRKSHVVSFACSNPNSHRITACLIWKPSVLSDYDGLVELQIIKNGRRLDGINLLDGIDGLGEAKDVFTDVQWNKQGDVVLKIGDQKYAGRSKFKIVSDGGNKFKIGRDY